jgi:hypothetical protein
MSLGALCAFRGESVCVLGGNGVGMDGLSFAGLYI